MIFNYSHLSGGLGKVDKNGVKLWQTKLVRRQTDIENFY